MPEFWPGFHAHDGWYFERLEDGSVKISAAVHRSAESIILTPETWASVIASVGPDGESSHTYFAALATHKG